MDDAIAAGPRMSEGARDPVTQKENWYRPGSAGPSRRTQERPFREKLEGWTEQHRSQRPPSSPAQALLATGCVATRFGRRSGSSGRTDSVTPSHQEVCARDAAPATQTLVAKVEGDAVDIRVEGHTECREVRTTRDRVRDVQVFRSFADDAQERNVAAAFLLGAAVGLIAYAANQAPCAPTTSGCSVGAASAAEYTLVGLAAVPLGLIG